MDKGEEEFLGVMPGMVKGVIKPGSRRKASSGCVVPGQSSALSEPQTPPLLLGDETSYLAGYNPCSLMGEDLGNPSSPQPCSEPFWAADSFFDIELWCLFLLL